MELCDTDLNFAVGTAYNISGVLTKSTSLGLDEIDQRVRARFVQKYTFHVMDGSSKPYSKA